MPVNSTIEVSPQIDPTILTQQAQPEVSPLFDESGRLRMSRLAEMNEPVIDLTVPLQPNHASLAPVDKPNFEVAVWPVSSEVKRPNLLKRAWNRANLLYTTAPTDIINKVAGFFTKEDETGEISLRKGRVALAAAGLAVTAAGVSYVKYKHGVASSNQSSSHHNLIDQLQPAPKSRPKTGSEHVQQHLNDLTSAVHPKPKNLNILPGDQPWNVLERSGVKPDQINQHLTQAAQRLQAKTGTNFMWHNYPGGQAWLEVGGRSDTHSVLKLLTPYL